MAVQTLYLESTASGDAINATNAIGNTPNTWAGVTNSNTSWTQEWYIQIPTFPNFEGAQSVAVRFRKGSNSGNPSVMVEVRRQGAVLGSVPNTAITSTTGQDVVVSFTDNGPVGGLSLYVSAVSVGGSPSSRNSAQMAMATWTANGASLTIDFGSITSVAKATSAYTTPALRAVASSLTEAVSSVDVTAFVAGDVPVNADSSYPAPRLYPSLGIYPSMLPPAGPVQLNSRTSAESSFSATARTVARIQPGATVATSSSAADSFSTVTSVSSSPSDAVSASQFTLTARYPVSGTPTDAASTYIGDGRLLAKASFTTTATSTASGSSMEIVPKILELTSKTTATSVYTAEFTALHRNLDMVSEATLATQMSLLRTTSGEVHTDALSTYIGDGRLLAKASFTTTATSAASGSMEIVPKTLELTSKTPATSVYTAEFTAQHKNLNHMVDAAAAVEMSMLRTTSGEVHTDALSTQETDGLIVKRTGFSHTSNAVSSTEMDFVSSTYAFSTSQAQSAYTAEFTAQHKNLNHMVDAAAAVEMSMLRTTTGDSQTDSSSTVSMEMLRTTYLYVATNCVSTALFSAATKGDLQNQFDVTSSTSFTPDFIFHPTSTSEAASTSEADPTVIVTLGEVHTEAVTTTTTAAQIRAYASSTSIDSTSFAEMSPHLILSMGESVTESVSVSRIRLETHSGLWFTDDESVGAWFTDGTSVPFVYTLPVA